MSFVFPEYLTSADMEQVSTTADEVLTHANDPHPDGSEKDEDEMQADAALLGVYAGYRLGALAVMRLLISVDPPLYSYHGIKDDNAALERLLIELMAVPTT